MTSFIIFFGIGTVVFGRLSDLFGVGHLLSIGIVIYAAGSLAGFLGRGSYPLVLAARVIQGMGGSSLPALVMVIVARHFAPEVRGAIFGSIGSVVAFAAGFGPVIGGFVASRLGWAWLFLIPLLTLAALPFIGRLLPAEERRPGRVDVAGALLMALGLGSLMVFLTYLRWPWFLAAGSFLVLFALRLRWVKEPFIDPSLFSNRPFRRGVIAALLLFACLMSMFFALPLMLSRKAGLGPASIGLILFPGSISGVFFGPLAGRLADGCGNRFVLRIGLGLFVAGLINGVSQTLSPERTGVGMGLFNLAGFVAGALGTAIVGMVLDARLLDFGGVLVAIALVFAIAGGAYVLSLGKPTERACSEPGVA